MGRTTSIVLGDGFAPFIERLVASGRYGSVSDVVRAGLRELQLAEYRMGRMRRFLERCPVETEDPLTAEQIEERDRDIDELETGELVPMEVAMARFFPDDFDSESDVVELERSSRVG